MTMPRGPKGEKRPADVNALADKAAGRPPGSNQHRVRTEPEPTLSSSIRPELLAIGRERGSNEREDG
jgi:hypothetical protein